MLSNDHTAAGPRTKDTNTCRCVGRDYVGHAAGQIRPACAKCNTEEWLLLLCYITGINRQNESEEVDALRKYVCCKKGTIALFLTCICLNIVTFDFTKGLNHLLAMNIEYLLK